MFSPYYAWARKRGAADAENHCAINVALYGPASRWCMTERGKSSLRTTRERIEIGPSSLHWSGDSLTIRFEEWTVPLPSRLRGTVVLRDLRGSGQSFVLDANGRHRWFPLSPFARCEVRLDWPDLQWAGSAYFDCNRGSEPLEAAFTAWQWSRAHTGTGAAILYDAERCDGSALSLSLAAKNDGSLSAFEMPHQERLASTSFGISRHMRCDGDYRPTIRQTLENAPFYSRSLVDTSLHGERTLAVHESLSLDRFRKPWVRMMLPFRMPRTA